MQLSDALLGTRRALDPLNKQMGCVTFKPFARMISYHLLVFPIQSVCEHAFQTEQVYHLYSDMVRLSSSCKNLNMESKQILVSMFPKENEIQC